MFALRMNAPGLRSRYVDQGIDAVLAVAPRVLVVSLPWSAYRILTLGVTPKTAFFVGVLWCVDGCRRTCSQWLLILSAPVGIRSPHVLAAVKICGAPQSIYEYSRAVLRTLAAALHRELGAKDRPASHPAASRAACESEGLRKTCEQGGNKRTSMNRIPPAPTAACRAEQRGSHPWYGYCLKE